MDYTWEYSYKYSIFLTFLTWTGRISFTVEKGFLFINIDEEGHHKKIKSSIYFKYKILYFKQNQDINMFTWIMDSDIWNVLLPISIRGDIIFILKYIILLNLVVDILKIENFIDVI